MLNQQQVIVTTKGGYTIKGMTNPKTNQVHSFQIYGVGLNPNHIYYTFLEAERIVNKKIADIVRKKQEEHSKEMSKKIKSIATAMGLQ